MRRNYFSNQFCVVGKRFFQCFFLSQIFFPHNEWWFFWITNSLFKSIRMCLVFFFLCALFSCVLLFFYCELLIFIRNVSMEILWGLCWSWGLFFSLPLWSSTNQWPPQVKFFFWGFSEHTGNRNQNPHEVQLVVNNSQGIIIILLLLTLGLRQSVSLLFPSVWWSFAVGKFLWSCCF